MLTKPTFAELVRHFPDPSRSFGVTHACAIRMSRALMETVPDFFAGFTGRLHPSTGTISSSLTLANYLEAPHVGWTATRLASRAEAQRLRVQGIIFWDVLPDADQIEFRTRAEAERQAAASREGRTVRPREIRASPNHIDLWDPVSHSLPGTGGFSMTWVPESGIVESVRFWPIPARGPFRVNPHALPRGMQCA